MRAIDLAPWPPLFLLFFGAFSVTGIAEEQGSELPTFTWLDNLNINVLFPNGVEDTIKLWEVEKFGNLAVPCLYEGTLKEDNTSSVAVSGCQYDQVINLVIYSINLPQNTMFNIINGTVEEVENIYFGETNAKVTKTNRRRLIKRGAYIDDGDYDEVAFDNGVEPPQPPAFLSLEVKLAFEETLLAEKVTEVAARQYIARVFTLGKQHLRHPTLGSVINLKVQGPIRRIIGKSWVPNASNLTESKAYKDPENKPITFFCYNQDRDNDTGISYIRRACHEEKGVAIVAARNDINKAAQTYAHECGHWLGLPHDAEYDEELGTTCEGSGLMSNASMPGGRPAQWSQCNKRKFRRWYSRNNNKNSRFSSHCLKDEIKDIQMETSCLGASYKTVVAPDVKCNSIKVTGADYADCNGIYNLSPNRVPWMPSRPVYGNVTLDRYIYWNARGHGWSIGSKDDMKTGGYHHYSGIDSPEPWEAPWTDGITVKCQSQEGVVLIKSTGEAAERLGNRLGYFDEIPDKLNDRPVYKQRGGDTLIYYDGVKKWWVNDILGKKEGWLQVPSKSLNPPTSGWFLVIDGSWHAAAVNDTSLKVSINPPYLENCDNINISATGLAAVKQKDHMGLYKWVPGEMLNGRKLYHNGKKYLRVKTGYTAWSTGSTINGSSGIQSGKATNCPCFREAGPRKSSGRGWWAYWDNKEWKVDTSLKITCV